MKKAGFDVLMVSADGTERNDVMQFEECPHYIIPMTRRITPFADANIILETLPVPQKRKA
jgi:hypothetical protein